MDRLKPKILIAAFLTLLTFLYSCQEEVYDMLNIEDQELIKEVKGWHESNHLPVMTLGTNSKEGAPPVLLKGLWEKAFTSKENGIEVVEVPLASKGRFGISSKASVEKMEIDNNSKWTHSLTRLVVKKNNDQFETFLMTMIANPGFLEKSDFYLHRNTFLKIDSKYHGAILYHTVKGDFIKGDYLKNGEIIGKVEKNNKSISNLRTESCVTWKYETVNYYQNCVQWVITTEHEGEIVGVELDTDCYGNYSVETEYTVVVCGEDVDPYTADDGTGSAGYQGDDPWPQNRCLNDPLWEMKLSSHSNISHWKMAIYGCHRSGTSCTSTTKWHHGYDLEAEMRTPVYPMMDGTVYQITSAEDSDGYGNNIIIKSGNAYIRYAHLDELPNLELNSNVYRSTQMAWSGDSDTEGAPHLHIELRVGSSFYSSTPTDLNTYFGTSFDSKGNPVRVNGCY